MITVTDNFLDRDSFEALGNISMMYSKVHWIGRFAEPENEFHELVHEIFCHNWPDGVSSISGATAWWNIRPIDPKPHSDLIAQLMVWIILLTRHLPPLSYII